MQSWRLEPYQTSLYTTENRLVVELKSSDNPLVVTDDWKMAVAVELGANVSAKFNVACTAASIELRALTPGDSDSAPASVACMAASSELRAIPDLTLIHPPTHPGFRWEEWPEGLCLHFPPSDLRQKQFWAKLCFLVSVGAAVASSGLIALGYSIGPGNWLGELAGCLVVVAFLGMVFAALNSLQYEQERHLALLEFARLTIGLEEVTAENRAGRRQT